MPAAWKPCSTITYKSLRLSKSHFNPPRDTIRSLSRVGRFFDEKLEYIHYNPVKKGFVEKPEDWKYSSAWNYLLEDDSLIEIDRIT
jgi:hypothetical protein